MDEYKHLSICFFETLIIATSESIGLELNQNKISVCMTFDVMGFCHLHSLSVCSFCTGRS